MLQPGEFVIRKKAVQKLGTQRLHSMNKFAGGGSVAPDQLGSAEIRSKIVRTGKRAQYKAGERINAGDQINLDVRSIAFDGGKIGNTQFEKRVAASLGGQWLGGNSPVDVIAPGYGPIEVRNRSKLTSDAELADKLARYKGNKSLSNEMVNDTIDLGRIYVAYNTGKLSEEELNKKKVSGKEIKTLNRLPKGAKKSGYDFREQKAALGGYIQSFAKGGDVVPAMLTPGEFVINKKAASRIGSQRLNKLNKADRIQGFNKGGAVGSIQRFALGGGVDDVLYAT